MKMQMLTIQENKKETKKESKKICMHCELMQKIYKKGVCKSCYNELISE